MTIDRRVSLYAGVNKLIDQQPDVLGPAVDVNRPISPVGRSIYAGVKVRLDRR